MSGPLYRGIHNLSIPSIVWCSMPSACEAILCTKSTASIQLFSKVHLDGENCWSGCFRASRPNPRLTIRAACLGPSLLLTYILLPRQPPGYTPAHSCAIFFVIWMLSFIAIGFHLDGEISIWSTSWLHTGPDSDETKLMREVMHINIDCGLNIENRGCYHLHCSIEVSSYAQRGPV